MVCVRKLLECSKGNLDAQSHTTGGYLDSPSHLPVHLLHSQTHLRSNYSQESVSTLLTPEEQAAKEKAAEEERLAEETSSIKSSGSKSTSAVTDGWGDDWDDFGDSSKPISKSTSKLHQSASNPGLDDLLASARTSSGADNSGFHGSWAGFEDVDEDDDTMVVQDQSSDLLSIDLATPKPSARLAAPEDLLTG